MMIQQGQNDTQPSSPSVAPNTVKANRGLIGISIITGLLCICVLLGAIGGLSIAAPLIFAPTITPSATITSTATLRPTATLKPTSTPRPTATKVPPTPTPVPMGTSVSNGKYQVNVIYMRTLETVYLDKMYHWVPKPGYMFVEIGVKIKNLQSNTSPSIKWATLFLKESTGKTASPVWGEFKAVAHETELNPKSLVFRQLQDLNEMIVFSETVFVRAIYTVSKQRPANLVFQVPDIPGITIIVP